MQNLDIKNNKILIVKNISL